MFVLQNGSGSGGLGMKIDRIHTPRKWNIRSFPKRVRPEHCKSRRDIKKKNPDPHVNSVFMCYDRPSVIRLLVDTSIPHQMLSFPICEHIAPTQPHEVVFITSRSKRIAGTLTFHDPNRFLFKILSQSAERLIIKI